MKTVLVLAPHLDDGELGAGGLIARLAREGAEVHYVGFSFSRNTALWSEHERAARCLGIDPGVVYDFPTRRFQSHRQEILDRIITIRNEFDPDTVLLPATNHTHQDHHVVTAEAIRAFRKVTLLGYEVTVGARGPLNVACFMPLLLQDVEVKVKAVACFQSLANRVYMTEEAVLSIVQMRGLQINTQYAEAFEVLRWVM